MFGKRMFREFVGDEGADDLVATHVEEPVAVFVLINPIVHLVPVTAAGPFICRKPFQHTPLFFPVGDM